MSIPAELEAIPHWVAWRWEIVGDRRTKVPYNPKTGNKAASTRPSTWGTFEEAQAARMDGIGFVVTPDDPYCGVDIDHCLRAGQLLPVAKRIVDTLDSYTEVTPSGDGVRVWVKAQLTRPGRTKAIGDGVKLELYDSGRYFTVTGRAGRVSEIRDRQAELDEIHREFFPDRPVQAGPFRGAALTMSDWELLNRARAATNGANFERLWRGDTSGHGDDDSVADCALLCHLAFWTNRDAEQMDRLFRQSGLYREKWERQDYRANTIAAALARTSDGYSGAASHADANTRPVAQEVATDAAGADDERATPPTVDGLIELSDISDAIDEYYQHGATPGEHPGWDSLAHLYRIQRGQWTLVTGQPTHGKTTWLDALLVNLIDKLGWRFVICSPENQPLEQHFAQLAERVVGAPFFDIPGFPPRMSWEELQFAKAFLGQSVSFALSDHPTIDAILAVARHKIETQGLDGLVIDPWNTIEHSRPKGLSESEYVGVALDHFRRFARRYGIHLWLVAHPTKLQKERRYDEQNKPVIKDGRVFTDYPITTPYDVSGSANWFNMADNAVTVWRDDLGEENRVQVHVTKIRFRHNGKKGYAELVYDRSCGRFSDTGNWFVHGRSVPVEQTTIPPSPSPERPRYERDESEWSGSAETGDAAWQAADDAADVAEEMRRWEAEQLALGGITRPGADEEATNELA